MDQKTLSRIIKGLERFGTINREDIPYLLGVLRNNLPAENEKNSKLYNHAFEVAFSINSDNDGESVTEKEMIQGLEERLKELKATPGLAIEACGKPYDTYDNDIESSLKFIKEE